MEVRPGYKQTEVGVIPEDWELIAISDVTTKVGSGITPTGGNRVYKTEGRPFIRSQNVGWGNLLLDDIVYIDDETHSRFGDTEIRCGDVFLNITGASIGRSAVAVESIAGGNVNQHVCIIRVDQKLNVPRIINYLLLSKIGQHQIDSFQAGGNRQGLNFAQVRSIQLPLPRFPEQRAIAEALGDVDELLGALDRLIAKKRDLKQAAMQQLLTGQIRLPGFSGKWSFKTLGELGTWKGGMTPSMRNPNYWIGGTVPWVSSGDVKEVRLERTGYSITPHAVKQGATTLLPTKSIIVVTRSGILRKYLPVAINEVPMAINQDVKALIPNCESAAEYVLHTLIGHGSEILKRCMKSGTTVESIDMRWLKDFSIPFPDIAEQTAIAEVLSDMDAEIAALERRREKTRALKKGMMQELLTGRTRLI